VAILLSVLQRQLIPGEDVKLRFDGIRPPEDDRLRSAVIPEFSDITADLISNNLLVGIRLRSVHEKYSVFAAQWLKINTK